MTTRTVGSNMQRQAVPLLRAEAPLVGTGMEFRAAGRRRRRGRGRTRPAAAIEVSADLVSVQSDDGSIRDYRPHKFRRSTRASYNQRPIVEVGQRVEPIIRSSPMVRPRTTANWRCPEPARGIHALGGSQLRGTRSSCPERLVRDDVLSSIHIEEHEVDARDTAGS